MLFSVNDPKHWRDCAEEVRVISQTAECRVRVEMLAAAAVYDQLAKLAQTGPLLQQLRTVPGAAPSIIAWNKRTKP